MAVRLFNIPITPWRWLAILVSVVFHPLWWPSLGLYLLLVLNPFLFGVNEASARTSLLLQVFALTFVLPVFSIFLMRKLALINSYQLTERLDRIGPYMVTMIFYLWLYLSIRHDAAVPLVYNIFIFGALITLGLVFVSNLFFKISAHTSVMGGVVAMTWLTFNFFSHETFTVDLPGEGLASLSWYSALVWVLLLAGLVGTCRMFLRAHTLREIYLGYLAGFVSQWIAFKILF
ncbi:MAG TPA: hypothetical protein PKM27_09760 [Saprospiraceae bacterium]|nr:hypothetical protein [Saprospiraceae bacterium]HNT21474.1 hypothetical protein [Saprospiraceae bacterium]